MNTIDITSELRRFEKHLEHNPRTIFSAKFGDGKTYFLQEYMRQHKSDTLFIVLHPINYSVATNEDVFEYIKRDILVELSKQEEFKEVDWEKVKKTLIDYDSVLEECEFLSDALPVAKAMLVPFRLFNKIDDKYAIDKYFDRFSQMKGVIFEQDQFTAAIKATIEEIREKGKRCVLIIEDLDRIDPRHLFRILNVLGAHIDEEKDTNKFGFDNIVAVLHYYTTEHVFHHFYGEQADYSGYMAKFYCHNIFEYSIKSAAHKQLLDFLRTECRLDDESIRMYEWYQDVEFSKKSTIQKHVEDLSVRDIVHVLEDLQEQFYPEVMYGGREIRIQDAPILKMLAVFVRMNFHFTTDNLRTFLMKSVRHFELLGNLVCTNSKFNYMAATFSDGEQTVIRFVEDAGTGKSVQYGGGTFNKKLAGSELGNEIANALQWVYSCVHDCKPLV